MKYLILIFSIIFSFSKVNAQELKTFSVYFENNSAKLDKEQQKILAEFIEEQSKLNTIIKFMDGYTDSVGTTKSNLILAKKRLDYVLNQIPKNKIKIIETRVFGEDYPSKIVESDLSKFRKVEITYFLKELKESTPVVVNEIEDPKETIKIAKFRENFTSETPIVLDVKFYGGTANLMPGSEEEIIALYKFLAGNKSVKALIRGHVCCQDDMPLSVQRANEVYSILIQKGIDPKRLDFKGFSNYLPVAKPELTEEDRQKNRRVDVVFLK